MINATEPRAITPEAAKSSDPGHGQDASATEATLRRLNSQIRWYDVQAVRNDFAHKSLRVISLAAAATIPVLAAISAPSVGGAVLGAGIVVLEGMQGLFQFSRNCVAFGVTREALKREKYLYVASAGPYAKSRDRPRLLAERVEALVAQETSSWASVQHVEDGPDQEQSRHL